MLHIIHPDYTWFLLYSCLFVTFAVQIFFSRFVIQDVYIILGLLVSIAINYPADEIQDFLGYRNAYLKEVILLLTSFALVTRYLSKKLLIHIASLTLYFTSLTISHATKTADFVMPFVSLVLIYSFYVTHHSMPHGSVTKNGIYFTTLLMFTLQELMQYENPSIFYTMLYVTFATVFACRAFLSKDYSSKVFYTFFSFFILTVAHIFLQIDVVNTVQYLLFYSTLSYFLYSTIFPHRNSKMHIIFLVHAIVALIHICYTTLNPEYFLLNIIHSQTVTNSALHYLSTFCYFTIFICAIQLIFRIFRKIYIKNKINWVHFIYATVALIILLEAQVVQKKLSSTSDTSYFGVTFAAFVHIFYLVITYGILMFSRMLSKKLLFQREFQGENAFARRLIKVNPFGRRKHNIVTMWIHNLPSFRKFIIWITKRVRFMKMQMQTNLSTIQSGVFILIPAFVCFYMIIAIFY